MHENNDLRLKYGVLIAVPKAAPSAQPASSVKKEEAAGHNNIEGEQPQTQETDMNQTTNHNHVSVPQSAMGVGVAPVGVEAIPQGIPAAHQQMFAATQPSVSQPAAAAQDPTTIQIQQTLRSHLVDVGKVAVGTALGMGAVALMTAGVKSVIGYFGGSAEEFDAE